MKPSLLIDTASPRCTVALHDQKIISSRQTDAQRQSAQKILPLIEELLQESGIGLADVGCIGVVNGPGSFTGMRIGVAIAQGLGFANQIPVITVSSLAALAYTASEQGNGDDWLVVLRAREDEVYVGGFHCERGTGIRLLVPEQVVSLRDAPDLSGALHPNSDIALAGDVDPAECSGLFGGVIPGNWYRETLVDMSALATLVAQQLASGKPFEPSAALPNYVKEQMQYG